MTPLARCRRSSLRVPSLRPRDAAQGVCGRVDDARATLAGVLVAIALLVGGISSSGGVRDPLRPSVGHAAVDASAPSLHVVAGWPSAAPHSPRRAGSEGGPAWLAAPRDGAFRSGATAAPTMRAAAVPHSVVAAGFDATAPPPA